jgi:hypothetical protein
VHKIALANRLANAYHVLVDYAPAADMQMANSELPICPADNPTASPHASRDVHAAER